MTREDARKRAEVMMAYAEGKDVEFRIKGDERWETYNGKDTLAFEFNDIDYRIKPEPAYRPFRNTEECWEEMLRHQPFGWVKAKKDGAYRAVTLVNDDALYKTAFDNNTFVDGTPFGVKEDKND